jgi:formylglycine-generating enzyme required for sulfatase activity
MGNNDPEAFPGDAESPPRPVEVSPFAIAATAVTNAEFAAFVRATGHRTVAEQFGWSFVFHLQVPAAKRKKSKFQKKVPGLEWWLGVEGAAWHKPEGPGSTLEGRMDHPAVHIAWFDAIGYCRWANCRLPTEAEWEFAARGGLKQKKFPWGDDLMPGGRHMCNIWQGKFPHENLGDDGYRWTAPARSFPPNGYGLYNVCGNVWEWCADWFAPSWPQPVPKDYRGPLHAERRVIRGGSFLCHRSYCTRYRVGARSSNTPDSTTSHCGFRVARDAPLS